MNTEQQQNYLNNHSSLILTPPLVDQTKISAMSPTDQKFRRLKNELNDISAIHGTPTPILETFHGVEEKIIAYTTQINWDDIRRLLIEHKEVSNAIIKAGKALCFGLQLYIKDTKYPTKQHFSKIDQIQSYLLKHVIFIENLTANIKTQLRN